MNFYGFVKSDAELFAWIVNRWCRRYWQLSLVRHKSKSIEVNCAIRERSRQLSQPKEALSVYGKKKSQ